jgi:hypothetical protein
MTSEEVRRLAPNAHRPGHPESPLDRSLKELLVVDRLAFGRLEAVRFFFRADRLISVSRRFRGDNVDRDLAAHLMRELNDSYGSPGRTKAYPDGSFIKTWTGHEVTATMLFQSGFLEDNYFSSSYYTQNYHKN